jgi:ribosomal protein L36
MRVRSAIKKLCDSCKVVKRRGKLYIVCKASPKVCETSADFSVAEAHILA